MRQAIRKAGLALVDRVGRDRAYVHGLRVPVWIGSADLLSACSLCALVEHVTYLHILHRIRLLATITGVFGADSDPGVCGYLANMSPGGTEPSPSDMIRLVLVPGQGMIARGTLTHHFLDRSLHVKHPNRLGPARDLVGRLMEYLELLDEAFVGAGREVSK